MNKKILIIEDRMDIQKEWKDSLAEYPVEIISAYSVVGAKIAFNSNNDLDIIAVDACVPGSEPNTMEIVKNFRTLFRGPMIAISNRDDFNNLLVSAGCDHKTEKYKLFEKIKEILNF